MNAISKKEETPSKTLGVLLLKYLDLRAEKCYNKAMEQAKSQKRISWRGFFKENYSLVLAPVVVAALFLVTLVLNGVYPFGTEYTLASYDLSAQIAPFIEHLFDVFDGKSSLSLSYAVVGGADVTGTFLYFFISPFSFLFLIFGDGKVAHASSIVLLCKLVAISFAGTWFAKKLFAGIPNYLCACVGILYAYCGYTFVSNTYINWMDFLIYLPFAVYAFRRFVRTGKFLPFSILVGCCIYTCFSIACFSLFTVYPALVAYGLLCVEKGEKNKFVAYLSLSFVVAILMALPVLFPALGAYSVSGRGGSLFENLWKGFSVDGQTGEIGSFVSSKFFSSYMDAAYAKWTYIFSDSIFVILTLVWFYRTGLKNTFAQFMLVAGALTLLPLLVDESMNLLNMGSYMSYALRFGFLNALYFLGGACLCLQGLCYKFGRAYDGTPILAPSPEGVRPCARKAVLRKENKTPLVCVGVLLALGLAAFAFACWYVWGDNALWLMKKLGSDSSNFSSGFAHSLGGLEVIIVLFFLVAVVGIVGCSLVGSKKISPKLLSFALIALLSTQVVFYNAHLVVGNCSTQHEALGSYQTLNEEFTSRKEGYFRVKDYDDAMTACAPFTAGANSFSVFSSVIDRENFTVFELFGYKGNGKNSFKSSHDKNKRNRNDEFGDAFLGYKYFLSEKEDLHEREETKSYIKPVYAQDAAGANVHLTEGGLYAYENEIAFPTGYTVSGAGFRFVAENNADSSNRKKNQEALFEYLWGKELDKVSITPKTVGELSEYLHTKKAEVAVSAGKITARVTAKEGESLLLNFVAIKGYEARVNGKKVKLAENDLKLLSVALEEGENEVVFEYTSPYIKQSIVGLAVGTLGLAAVVFVTKRTRLVEKCAPAIAGLGVAISVAVVGFFMAFPTCALLSKLVALLRGWLV